MNGVILAMEMQNVDFQTQVTEVALAAIFLYSEVQIFSIFRAIILNLSALFPQVCAF